MSRRWRSCLLEQLGMPRRRSRQRSSSQSCMVRPAHGRRCAFCAMSTRGSRMLATLSADMATANCLRRDFSPRRMLTSRRARAKVSANQAHKAALPRPSSAGAAMRIRSAPACRPTNAVVLAPGWAATHTIVLVSAARNHDGYSTRMRKKTWAQGPGFHGGRLD